MAANADESKGAMTHSVYPSVLVFTDDDAGRRTTRTTRTTRTARLLGGPATTGGVAADPCLSRKCQLSYPRRLSGAVSCNADTARFFSILSPSCPLPPPPSLFLSRTCTLFLSCTHSGIFTYIRISLFPPRHRRTIHRDLVGPFSTRRTPHHHTTAEHTNGARAFTRDDSRHALDDGHDGGTCRRRRRCRRASRGDGKRAEKRRGPARARRGRDARRRSKDGTAAPRNFAGTSRRSSPSVAGSRTSAAYAPERTLASARRTR